MTSAILFALLFLFLLIGIPVAVSLGLASILTLLFFTDTSLASVALKLFETLSEHYTLLAIFLIAPTFFHTL